ncbi:glycosyltransferase family 87 protein [Gluconacetobacter tumulisoli]|uniref:DUF2029 domain-containing protein n=1 Tax=Gluconacetobacter tumulisoli TaxID=1286189 RepID=A0A7W4PM93_9PROT|nr:glycosyltransferase family 87 protein [Gluconacetobacter tumulisoli]MBB2203317.1 DUF2029 domain-containing protein [Gluconacetobacter tumulisoli]
MVELLFALILVLGTHGMIMPARHPTTTDYVSFYAAGRQVNAGVPAQVYDPAAHHAAEQAAREIGIPYVHFFYPPVFLLICAPFARLPYLASFIAFQALSLIAALTVLRRVLGLSKWMTIICGLAFPATLWNIGVGQNALLTVALFGTATLLVDKRPVLGGAFIGMLCYKPQLGLFFPIALLAQGNWRAILSATGTSALLILMSLVIFGRDTWTAFLNIARQAHGTYETGAVHVASLTAPYGPLVAFHAPLRVAYGVQAATTLLLACAVYRTWSRPCRLPIRAAVIAAATPVATPMTMFYDLTLSGLAIAWLVRDGCDRGFPPWQKFALFCTFPLPLLSGNLGNSHGAVALVASVAVLAVALIGARRGDQADLT